jgi:hypothetical protein
MYIPMGGNKTKFYNVWPIFIFVAIWHDMKWEMAIFGVGCSAIMMYEGLIRLALNLKKVINSLFSYLSLLSLNDTTKLFCGNMLKVYFLQFHLFWSLVVSQYHF